MTNDVYVARQLEPDEFEEPVYKVRDDKHDTRHAELWDSFRRMSEQSTNTRNEINQFNFKNKKQ